MIDWTEGRNDVPSPAQAAAEDAARRVCGVVADVLDSIAAGAVSLGAYREAMQARDVTLTDVIAAHDLAREAEAQHIRYPPIHLGMPDKDRARALKGWRKPPLAEARAVLGALAEDWSAGRPRLQSITARMVIAEDGTARPQFLAHERRDVQRKDRVILNLDASADRMLAAAVFGSDAKMETIGACRFARVVQVAGTSFAKTAVGVVKGREGAATAEQRMKFIVEGLRVLVRTHGAGRVACITYKDLVPEIAKRVPGILTAHFGRLRGLNAMKGAAVLVVVGRPLPPARAMEDDARALVRGTGRVLDLPGEYRLEHRGVRMRDGRRIGLPMRVHPDPVVDALRAAACEREVEQAIDRLRAVRREGDPPTIFILSDEVLNVTLDEIMDARAWAAGLAMGDDLVDGRPVVVGERWTGQAAGGVILEDMDSGRPLAERQAETVTATVGGDLVAKAVQFRCEDDEAQSPINIFSKPTALRFVLAGTILEGERNTRPVFIPEHLARALPALRRMIAQAEGRGLRGLALADKAMIELAKSAKIAAMKDAPKTKPEAAVTWLSDALDRAAAAAGFAGFEAWAAAAGADGLLWRTLILLARGDDAVRASAWQDARFARFADGVLCGLWGRALAVLDQAPIGLPRIEAAALTMEMVAGLLMGVGEWAATVLALPRTLGAVVEAAMSHPFFTLRQVVTLDDALRVLAAASEEGGAMVPGMSGRGVEGRACAAT